MDHEEGDNRLRAVFQLCDTQNNGYISVDHFANLAREHFGAGTGDQDTEDIRKIVDVLDPTGDGKIHFEEFCQGVQQILELKSPCCSPVVSGSSPCLLPISSVTISESPNLPTRPNSLETSVSADSNIVMSWDHEEDSSGTHETSELSTFNEYDMMTDDDATPVATHDNVARGSFQTDRLKVSMASARQRILEDFHESLDGEKSSETQSFVRRSPERRIASDEMFDDIDGNFTELNDKVTKLEAHIQYLTETQQKSTLREIRLKEENSCLVERVHILEEQLRDVENTSKKKISEEQRKNREALSRVETDKALETDILSQKMTHMEGEYQSLKEEAPRLKSENERLRQETQHFEKQLSVAQSSLSRLGLDHEDLQMRHKVELSEMAAERLVSAQLIEELEHELDEVRTSVEINTSTGSASSSGSTRDSSRSNLTRRELEKNLIRLKEVNAYLKEEKDELLLCSHIQEGRSLVNGGISLAKELEELPKDELLKTVQELNFENSTLRDYIDKLTLRIIEKNPSILEIPIQMGSRRK